MRKEACLSKKIEHNGKLIDAADLFDKVAMLKDRVKPAEMVDLIYDFDKKAGMVNDYDRRIRDPFFTVYGSSINPFYGHEKIATDMYAKQLELIASKENFLNKLASSYGQEFANSFKADAMNIYKSMPTPDKQNILNIARESNG